MRNIEKMTSKRDRLAYGEVNDRRQRNDKLHKPERIAKTWTPDRYDPNLNKRLAERKRALQCQAVQDD
uniref:Uncharacterized protein n=1 Tax=Salmonella phage SalP219 TaxID=3158864 RepID=A0AAU7PIJ3_9CAUD